MACKVLVFTATFFSCFFTAQFLKQNKKHEVFAFIIQCSPEVYSKFDWSLITTAVWFKNPVDREFVKYAHARNVSVLKLASGITENDLLNETARKNWARKELSAIVEQNLDGINLDYELAVSNLSPEQIGLSKLVHQTWATLKQKNPKYKVTFDVPWSANCIDGRCYDIKAMAHYLDMIFVMSYDEQSQIKSGPCVAGANSGFYQTFSGITEYLNFGIPSSKLILGVPWYGRDYPCETYDKKTNLCHIREVPFRGVNCSDSPGVEKSYSTLYSMMNTSRIKPVWNKPSKSVYFSYKEKSGKMHQVWFDNPRSLQEKYNLVKKLKLGGAGMWNAVHLDNSDTAAGRKMRKTFWDQFKSL